MKKLTRFLALMGAIAMVLGAAAGFVSCSDGGSSGGGGGGFESKTKTVAPAELAEMMGVTVEGLESVTKDAISASAEDIVGYDVTDAGLVLVSKKAGVTVLSCDINNETKKLTVTVGADGTISVAAYKPGDEDRQPDDDKYTYHWKFTNVTDASKTDVNQELSAEEVTPEGAYDLKLSLNGYFNSVEKAKTIGSTKQTAIYGKASVGAVEVGGDTSTVVAGSKGLVSLELKGPFKATMYASTNSDSDKTDRYARIMVGDTEFCNESEKTANKLPAAGTTVVAEYTGTDRVLVKFGGTSITRIYDIIVETTANQNPGAFNASTNSDTANDVDTLGIVGTAVSSSDEAVATAKIEGGKIAITSVGKGSATITVSADGSKNTATIPVTVGATGEITLGKIVKNTFEGEVKDLGAIKTALSGKLHSRFGTITTVTLKDESSAITVAENKITAIEAGTGTVTVSDGNNNHQDVTVTVAATGAITFAAGAAPFILDDTELPFTATQLGLTPATATSATEAVATAAVADVDSAKVVKVTPCATAAGSAVITVKDASNNEAEITVTVDAKGDVKGEVTKKYKAPGSGGGEIDLAALATAKTAGKSLALADFSAISEITAISGAIKTKVADGSNAIKAGISFPENSTLTITTTKAMTLTVYHYSTSTGRNIAVEKGGAAFTTGATGDGVWTPVKVTDANNPLSGGVAIELDGAATWTIKFVGGEHKVCGLKLE